MQRIKKDDQVIVLAGKDKGRQGKVIKLIRNKSRAIQRVIVEGVNRVKKTVRPDPNRNVEGGIEEKEASLHISNVALYNSATGKADRVTFKTLEDGRKVRCYQSSGELVDI